MSFRQFMNETVTLVKKNGQRQSFKALVQPTSVFTEDTDIPVEEGDSVERTLPNGMIEKYVVQDRGFRAQFSAVAAHYNMKVRKEGSFKPAPAGLVTNIYNLHGPNARVNISSTDASVNVHSVTSEKLFMDLREAINRNVKDENRRSEMITAVEGMEQSTGSTTFLEKYQQFISCASDHMTLLAPFIPALTQMLVR